SLRGLSSFQASGGFEENVVRRERLKQPELELTDQTDDKLSAVCALVETCQGQRSLFKTDQNLFVEDDLLASSKLRKFGRRRRKFCDVVENNEPRPAQAPGQDFALL